MGLSRDTWVFGKERRLRASRPPAADPHLVRTLIIFADSRVVYTEAGQTCASGVSPAHTTLLSFRPLAQKCIVGVPK